VDAKTAMEIRPIDPKRPDAKTFKNLERLKEILKEAEPLHQRMVRAADDMARITREYGEAVSRIRAVADRLDGDGGGE